MAGKDITYWKMKNAKMMREMKRSARKGTRKTYFVNTTATKKQQIARIKTLASQFRKRVR